jgi:hypothetical protein
MHIDSHAAWVVRLYVLIMTLVRSLYKSYVFVAGIALILLGLGNYVTAESKVYHYQEIMMQVSSLLFPE